MFIINPDLAISDSSFILTQPQDTSLSSALRGQICSLCVSAGQCCLTVCMCVCVDSRIPVCTCANPGPQCVYLRMHAHVRCVCAPECVKQTWKQNWRQRCKNRGNTTGQWEHGMLRDPHPFIPLLPPAPSVSPSSSSLGHWGEWAAILILIPLSLCGPLAERGEWSPGFWNAQPLSSGHEGRVKGKRGRGSQREKVEREMVKRGRDRRWGGKRKWGKERGGTATVTDCLG